MCRHFVVAQTAGYISIFSTGVGDVICVITVYIMSIIYIAISVIETFVHVDQIQAHVVGG